MPSTLDRPPLTSPPSLTPSQLLLSRMAHPPLLTSYPASISHASPCLQARWLPIGPAKSGVSIGERLIDLAGRDECEDDLYGFIGEQWVHPGVPPYPMFEFERLDPRARELPSPTSYLVSEPNPSMRQPLPSYGSSYQSLYAPSAQADRRDRASVPLSSSNSAPVLQPKSVSSMTLLPGVGTNFESMKRKSHVLRIPNGLPMPAARTYHAESPEDDGDTSCHYFELEFSGRENPSKLPHNNAALAYLSRRDTDFSPPSRWKDPGCSPPTRSPRRQMHASTSARTLPPRASRLDAQPPFPDHSRVAPQNKVQPHQQHGGYSHALPEAFASPRAFAPRGPREEISLLYQRGSLIYAAAPTFRPFHH